MATTVTLTLTNGVLSNPDPLTSANRKTKTYTIPTGTVTSIAADTFRDCVKQATISIPNTVTTIGANAFRGCTGLKTVTFSGDITSIGDNAFEGCTSLTDITFNIIGTGTSQVLGNEVFRGCAKLTNVRITNLSKLKKVGFNVFMRTLYDPYWNSCVPLLIANGVTLAD